MGVAVTSSHVVSAAPSSLHCIPLLHERSLSWETDLHEPPQCQFIPWAAVLHKLLQHGSLPQGAVLKEQAAPAWVPCGIKSPASKPAPVWATLSLGPQILPEACFSVGFQQGHSLLQASTQSSLLPHVSPWAAGAWILHHGLDHIVQGNLWHLEHFLPFLLQ